MQRYITTPIYYLNGDPHIGHAYTTILGDVLKKFEMMRGNNVFYTTGTDEHGQKNQQSIEASGLSADEFLTRQSEKFKKLFIALGIDFDYYIRTSNPEHKKVVTEILNDIYKKGLIVKKSYSGLYCVGCEQFKKPQDLTADGLCPDHNVAPKEIKEENYFFTLEPFRQWLIEHIKQNPNWIQPAKYAKEVLGMLKEPLEDLCISRPKDRVWLGVDLPFDQDYVTYIWFDALVNYLSSLRITGAKFDTLWANSTHIIAKDILKPHCIYWPIMLKAFGLEPAKHTYIHGYWIGEGNIKMSKSIGNVVDPVEVIDIMGVDPLRFYLLHNMSQASDSPISINLLKQGYRQLANNIGNLQMRVLKMIDKNLNGQVPANPTLNAEDKKLLKDISSAFEKIYSFEANMEVVSNLAAEIVKAGDATNAYFAANTPWTLAKDPAQAERFQAIVYTTLEALRLISIASQPIMPKISQSILGSLGIDANQPLPADFATMKLSGSNTTKVGDPLFPMLAE